jgi:hypothetical protein
VRRLGERPVAFGIAGAIGQRRRGDDARPAHGRDRRGEGQGGIDPVAIHADVDVAPVIALDRKPVDELGRRRRVEREQSIAAPGGDLHVRAAASARAQAASMRNRVR